MNDYVYSQTTAATTNLDGKVVYLV